jgi:hypothetical protein
MKSSLLKITLLISPGLFGAGLLSAQPASPVSRSPISRGLPRLVDTGKPGAAASIEAWKFAIDDLSADGSANSAKSRKAGLDVLTLRAGAEWSRPLRGSGGEPQFVSFLLSASQSSVVEIAGARLGITLSPAGGSLQVMFDERKSGGLEWRSLGLHVPIEEFDGESLASLPLLTVHIDPVAGVWNLYAGMRLVADHLPLLAGLQQKFTVKAGHDGAWVGHLIMSDENPLYEDANANGIADAFEKQQRGAILTTTDSLVDRKLLAQQWQASQRMSSPPPLFVRRPIPNGAPIGRRD